MNVFARKHSSALPAFALAIFVCLFTQPIFASTVVVTPPGYHVLQADPCQLPHYFASR